MTKGRQYQQMDEDVDSDVELMILLQKAVALEMHGDEDCACR